MIIRAIFFAACCLLATGCTAKSPVATVQSSLLELDKSVTIGEAFETCKYFSTVMWTTRDEANRVYVDASCTFDGKRVLEALEASPKLINPKVLRDMADPKQRSDAIASLSAMNVTFRFILNRDKTVSFKDTSFKDSSRGTSNAKSVTLGESSEAILRTVYRDTFPNSVRWILGWTDQLDTEHSNNSHSTTNSSSQSKLELNTPPQKKDSEPVVEASTDPLNRAWQEAILETEAKKTIQERIDSMWQKEGDSVFAIHTFGNVETITQAKQLSFSLERTGPNTEADRLNGLEWQGSATLRAQVSRTLDGNQYPNWNSWSDGISGGFRMEKRNGEWKINQQMPYYERINPQKISLERLPK